MQRKNAGNRFSEIATIMARMTVKNGKPGGPKLLANLAGASRAGRAAVAPELATLKHRRDLFNLLARLRATPERNAVWKRAVALLPYVGRLSNFALPWSLRLDDADVPYMSKLLDLGCPFSDELFAASVVNNELKLATMFLEAGANPDIRTSGSPRSPLSYICIENNLNGMLQLLIGYGIKLGKAKDKDHSPLTAAIACGNGQAVNILLRAGVNPNREFAHGYFKGFPPLAFSVMRYVPSIMAALLDAGANVDQAIYADFDELDGMGEDGDTALMYAIRANVNGAVAQLLPRTSQLDVHPNDFEEEVSPIDVAFESKNWTALDLMINMPGQRQLKDWRLACMLYVAYIDKNLSVMKMLVEKGANPGVDIDDKMILGLAIPPKTPFDWQALEVMASSRTLSASAKSSALIAATGGPNELEVVKILLKHGADPSHTDIYDEETPMEMADDFLPEVRALFEEYAKTKKRKRNSNTNTKK